MRFRRAALVALGLTVIVVGRCEAVEVFRVSGTARSAQIWFEAEHFDERSPAGSRHFATAAEDPLAETPANTFGEALVRTGISGGRLSYTFDITETGAGGGEWYFFGRVINPNNRSDYLLVESDPDDDILEGPPFPGGNAAPFDNGDDRIFELDIPLWAWESVEHREGHTKELGDGVNTMHIYHREGDRSSFLDVIVWTNDVNYIPTDEDYMNATEVALSVDWRDRLTTTWASLRRAR